MVVCNSFRMSIAQRRMDLLYCEDKFVKTCTRKVVKFPELAANIIQEKNVVSDTISVYLESQIKHRVKSFVVILVAVKVKKKIKVRRGKTFFFFPGNFSISSFHSRNKYRETVFCFFCACPVHIVFEVFTLKYWNFATLVRNRSTKFKESLQILVCRTMVQSLSLTHYRYFTDVSATLPKRNIKNWRRKLIPSPENHSLFQISKI